MERVGSARRAALVLCGLTLSAVTILWAAQGDQTRRVGSFLATFAVAAVAYLATLACARRLSPRWLAGMLGLAALWRVLLVASPPLLSDDIQRYIWEGRIQLHGGNPFAWSDRPDAAKWVDLRDDVWRNVNHKDYTAIYPALWQLTSAGVVWVHDSIPAMKAFVVACEILLWLMLILLLRQRGLPRERILIVAWSPLALVEIAGSGHNDSLGILLAVAALVSLDAGRPWWSAVAAAAGTQAKVLPGLLAAAWARRYRLRHVGLAVAIVAALVVPYLSAGMGLLRSAGKHSRYWRFNETLFAPLAAWLGHEDAVRAGALVTVLVAVVCAARRVEGARAALAVVATWILLTPNVLPWYALWLLPWLVAVPAPTALVFTLTVPLAYLVYPPWYAGQLWKVGWGIRAAEYVPCILIGMLAHWGPRWARRLRFEDKEGSPDVRGRDVLLVFLKEPTPGTVKTRLASAIGDQAASVLYRRMAEAVVQATTTSGAGYLQVLAFAPSEAADAMGRWFPGRARWSQPPGDLGTRMDEMATTAFAHGARRVVIVGTDCPTIDEQTINTVLQRLDDHDVVLGPAEDGGYWLVGLGHPAPALFEGIPWSSAEVMTETLRRAKRADLTVTQLGMRRDIDTLEDLAGCWPTLEPLVRHESATRRTIRRALAEHSAASQ